MKKKPKSRPASTVCSLQAFAKLIGRSLPAVQGYIRAGMPTLGRRGRIHEIGIGPAVRWVLEDLERRHEEQLASADPRLAEARARKYEAEADLREMEASRRRDELVSRDDVILAGQAHVKAWKAQIINLPRRLVLSGVINREKESAVADQCRELLAGIAKWKTIDDAEAAAVRKRRKK